MSYQIRPRTENETPIERIFQKVVGRKMTPKERVCLQLKNGKPSAAGNSGNGAGLHRKNAWKLTRS